VTESSGSPLPGWHYGLHPRAVGMKLRSLERADLPLGEALRLEMAGDGPGGEDSVHLQYYISTHAGPWALWTSCARAELAAREAALRAVVPELTGEVPGQQPSPGRRLNPFEGSAGGAP
jgi:hypothetical protein